jgi:hypothetical protein
MSAFHPFRTLAFRPDPPQTGSVKGPTLLQVAAAALVIILLSALI